MIYKIWKNTYHSIKFHESQQINKGFKTEIAWGDRRVKTNSNTTSLEIISASYGPPPTGALCSAILWSSFGRET